MRRGTAWRGGARAWLTAAAIAVWPAAVRSDTLPPPAHQRLAREIFQELVEIDTTHAFGTTRAAEAVAARLRAAGFTGGDVQVLGPRPDRANLIARLRGHGRAQPILFLAHLDVVDARREDWTFEPFKLTEQDGWFYGRGTLDIKDEAADLVANLVRLKTEGFVPARDIVVALTADEEGGDANGAAWLLAVHPELVDVAYVINLDAGGGQIAGGRRVRNPVQTGEKVFTSFRLETTSPGGHSSLPAGDNAIYRLAAGLVRLAAFAFPVRLTETTRAYFTRLAEHETGTARDDLLGVLRTPPDPGAVARLSASPITNATLRTTCVATLLEAGHAENALPQRARATLQCRLLPDDDPGQVQATLAGVLADPGISVELLNKPKPSPASPVSPEVLRPVEEITAEMWPGVLVLPVMDPWSSDAVHFRRAGLPVYGVSGVFFDVDDVRAHGRDERVGVREFYAGVEFMYRLMKALGGAP